MPTVGVAQGGFQEAVCQGRHGLFSLPGFVIEHRHQEAFDGRRVIFWMWHEIEVTENWAPSKIYNAGTVAIAGRGLEPVGRLV